MIKMSRAILSVSDKTGIVQFAEGLNRLGIDILSTGGTLSLLLKNGIRAKSVSDYTGFPEVFSGRLKTLHPKLLGGLLYKRSESSHLKQANELGIESIDLVIVNLYPFEDTIKKKGVTLDEAIEQIDIGGPTMLRAAAKNHESVATICDPQDYSEILTELENNKGSLSAKTAKKLAVKVFQHTAMYDAVISHFLAEETSEEFNPESLALPYALELPLRYGENPHQKAAFYRAAGRVPRLEFEQLHGKELSYNNLMDLEAAWEGVHEFKEPAACVIKHNTPCGIALGKDLETATSRAIDSDTESAFGGIVGLNRKCDLKTAKVILKKLLFLEVIAAPSFTSDAIKVLQERKNLRLIKLNASAPFKVQYRYSRLGLLLQEADPSLRNDWKKFLKTAICVTKKKATLKDMEELFFAWRCVKLVKSNGIVLTRNRQVIGIGAGQTSRVLAVKIACMRAGEKRKGAFMASDGFFPMPDNIEIAGKEGIRAIVQPGGSIRDKNCIEEADRRKLVMVLTGTRHFRH